MGYHLRVPEPILLDSLSTSVSYQAPVAVCTNRCELKIEYAQLSPRSFVRRAYIDVPTSVTESAGDRQVCRDREQQGCIYGVSWQTCLSLRQVLAYGAGVAEIGADIWFVAKHLTARPKFSQPQGARQE